MLQGTPVTTCTTQLPNGKFCEATAHADMPFPICGKHASQIWRHINEMLKVVEPRAEIDGDSIPTGRERRSLVYYLQVGPMVKIGTTKHLYGRLRSYPPNRKLLAVEVGGRELEVQRHKQFAALLAGGNEWFRPEIGLIDHINRLRATQDTAPLTLSA